MNCHLAVVPITKLLQAFPIDGHIITIHATGYFVDFSNVETLPSSEMKFISIDGDTLQFFNNT